jgi:hypothetical protein
MTSPLSWIASLIKRKASTPPVPGFDARSAAGLPARTTAGLVPAATSGTRSTREECARHASTSRLPHSACLVPVVAALRLVCAVSQDIEGRETASHVAVNAVLDGEVASHKPERDQQQSIRGTGHKDGTVDRFRRQGRNISHNFAKPTFIVSAD